jgi:hypothetical protein
MTPESQIMDLLTKRKGRLFCEGCIALELRLPNPRTIKGAIDAVGAAKGFRWATEMCSRCGAVQDGIKAG